VDGVLTGHEKLICVIKNGIEKSPKMTPFCHLVFTKFVTLVGGRMLRLRSLAVTSGSSSSSSSK